MTGVGGASQDHVLICYSTDFQFTHFRDGIRAVAKQDNPNLEIEEVVGVGFQEGQKLDKQKEFNDKLKNCTRCIFVVPTSSNNSVFETEGPIPESFHADLIESKNTKREIWYLTSNEKLPPIDVSSPPAEKKMRMYSFAELLLSSGTVQVRQPGDKPTEPYLEEATKKGAHTKQTYQYIKDQNSNKIGVGYKVADWKKVSLWQKFACWVLRKTTTIEVQDRKTGTREKVVLIKDSVERKPGDKRSLDERLQTLGVKILSQSNVELGKKSTAAVVSDAGPAPRAPESAPAVAPRKQISDDQEQQVIRLFSFLPSHRLTPVEKELIAEYIEKGDDSLLGQELSGYSKLDANEKMRWNYAGPPARELFAQLLKNTKGDLDILTGALKSLRPQ